MIATARGARRRVDRPRRLAPPRRAREGARLGRGPRAHQGRAPRRDGRHLARRGVASAGRVASAASAGRVASEASVSRPRTGARQAARPRTCAPPGRAPTRARRSLTRTQLRLGPPCTPLNGSATPRLRRSAERAVGQLEHQVVLVEEREQPAVHEQAVGREVDVVVLVEQQLSCHRVVRAIRFVAHGAPNSSLAQLCQPRPVVSMQCAHVTSGCRGCRYAAHHAARDRDHRRGRIRRRGGPRLVAARRVDAAVDEGRADAAAHRPHRRRRDHRGHVRGPRPALRAHVDPAGPARLRGRVDGAHPRRPRGEAAAERRDLPDPRRGRGVARAGDLGIGRVDRAAVGRDRLRRDVRGVLRARPHLARRRWAWAT